MIVESLTTTLTLATTFVVLWALKYGLDVRKKLKRYEHIPGPKPKGIKGFFLGNIPDIIEQDRNGVSFTQYLAGLVSVYGKTFKVRLMSDIMVYTIEPKLVKEIYIDENFKKPFKSYNLIGFPGGERYMGHGLVTEMDHEKWRHRRALFNPGFQRQVLMTFMNEFNSKADILVDFLKTKADGKTEVVLLDQFNHTALDIIASVAFNLKLDSVKNPDNKFNEYIFESISMLKYYFQDPFIKYKPYKRHIINKHRHSIRYLRTTGRNQIIERLEMIKNNEELPKDILTSILKSHENEEFDLESMVDDFVTFFIAGQETTATLLSSLFLELGRNEDVLQKYEPKEALRLWPPAPQINRNCEKDLQSEKYLIPSGTTVATSTYASGRCEDYFKDAMKFNPDRFKKIESDQKTDNVISNYIYYPFSLGPRNCIGQNFAQIEAKVMIAKFIQNFDFKLNPNQSFAALQAGTLRPKDGTKVFLTLRN